MNAYYNISHLFIDKFIRDHKLEVYNNQLVDRVSSTRACACIYMNNIYLYIFYIDGEHLLVIETFPKKYKLYVLKWFGDHKDFMKVVNDLGIVHVVRGVNYADYSLLTCEKERRILSAVLNSIINRREYIVSKYGLK